MRRILYVAEKNDVAKGIASILSKGYFDLENLRKRGRNGNETMKNRSLREFKVFS